MQWTPTNNLHIGDVILSSKGAKLAPISSNNGAPVHWRTQEPLGVVFPPNTFSPEDKSTRVNLTLRPNEKQQAELQALDEAILKLCFENSERLFGKALSEAQIKDRYQGALRVSDKYPPAVRVKMCTEGPGVVRYWSPTGAPCRAPERWGDATVRPVVRIKSLWFMTGSFGVLLELTDAQVTQEEKSCITFNVTPCESFFTRV